MYAALEEAQKAFDSDEVPIGAVVVYNNRIIGKGFNQVEKLNDSTAHAEIIAITAASYHLKNKSLAECKLFVTVEPCLMCAGAIILSKINEIYFGANEPKFGACGSLYSILDDGKSNHVPKVYSGLFEQESATLMQNFFKKRRKSN